LAEWSAVAVTPVGKAPLTTLSQLIVAGVAHGTPGDGFAGSSDELDFDGAGEDGGVLAVAPCAPAPMLDGEVLPSPSNDGPVTTPATATPASAVVPTT
jgi:hypothetical protein